MDGPLLTPKEFFEIENLLSTYVRYTHARNRPIALHKALKQPTRPSRPTQTMASMRRELESMRDAQQRTQADTRQGQREILQKAIATVNGRIQASIGKVPAHVIASLDLQLRSITERASHL